MNFTNMPQMKLPSVVLPPNVPQPIPNIEIVLKPDTDPAVLLPQPIIQHHHHHGPISQANLDINNNEVVSTSDILPYTSLSLNKQRTYIEVEVLGELEKSQKTKLKNAGSVFSNPGHTSLVEDDSSSSSPSDFDEHSNSPNTKPYKSSTPSPVVFAESQKQETSKLQPTLKRRRGRPRKHPIPNSSTISDISVTPSTVISSPLVKNVYIMNNNSCINQEDPSFTNQIAAQKSLAKSADQFQQTPSSNNVVKRKRGRPRLPPLEERKKSKYVKKTSKASSNKIDLGSMIIQQFP